MKRFVFLLTTIFMCSILHAETFNQYWYVENNTLIQTTCETGGDIILPTAPTKYGYDFIGWEKLPYIRIEYLESTGTQWIDTGVVPNQDTGIKTKVTINSIINDEVNIFGSGQNYNYRAFENGVWNGVFFLNYGDTTYNMCAAKLRDNIILSLKNRSLNYSINNEDKPVIVLKTITFTSPYTMRLFANKRPQGVYTGKIQIYYFQIYDNDVLVRDFIPVLDPDGVPCMYDKVENKFYYNQGTGDFIAGPVIGGE